MRINVKNAKVITYKYYPETTTALKEAIKAEIEIQGINADLNCIDTSNITDMENIFKESKFNGDTSKCNVSKVKEMTWMFYNSPLAGKEPAWYKK